MCTCRKSWPERAMGNLKKSRLIHPAAARGDRQGVQQTGRRQVVCLHALTRRAGAHSSSTSVGRPGHHTERRARASVSCRDRSAHHAVWRGDRAAPARARGRDAKAIGAPAAAVSSRSQQTKAQRDGGVLRLCRRRQGPQNQVRRERRTYRGALGVQKVRRLGSGTSGHEGGSGGRTRHGEELKRRIRLVVAQFLGGVVSSALAMSLA